jgi:hypothetical protein
MGAPLRLLGCLRMRGVAARGGAAARPPCRNNCYFSKHGKLQKKIGVFANASGDGQKKRRSKAALVGHVGRYRGAAIDSATASATLMPSTAADRMPPA